MPNGYFDEVSGVKVTKRKDDGTKDTIILDEGDGTLHVSLGTTFMTTVSANVARDALACLRALRSRAVVEVQSNGRE